MRRKGKKATLISVTIAFAAVLILLAAGTVLRMHSRNLPFFQAFVSFVSDTFNPGSGA